MLKEKKRNRRERKTLHWLTESECLWRKQEEARRLHKIEAHEEPDGLVPDALALLQLPRHVVLLHLYPQGLRRASSGTVSGNVDSSSHTGTRRSSITLVFFITLSAFTPAMPTCVRLQRSSMSIGWGPVLALPSYSFISPAACGSFSCISLLLPYPGIEIWRREGVEMSFTEIHAPPISHIYFNLLPHCTILLLCWSIFIGIFKMISCQWLPWKHWPTLRVVFTGKLALGSNTSPFGPVVSKKSGFLTYPQPPLALKNPCINRSALSCPWKMKTQERDYALLHIYWIYYSLTAVQET